jgi:tRNA G10  N-methylase Trm11
MTAHPAKFSDEILARIHVHDTDSPLRPLILDPFAGTGKVHRLDGIRSIGVEIEPEWTRATSWPTPCTYRSWTPALKA